MKTISASGTFFYKRIFPTFWFGFLAIFLLTGLGSGIAAKSPMFLVIPLVMAVFGFVIMKKLLFDLADEVFDAGDHLVIHKSGRELHVRIADIINVSTSLMQNPPRVTLRLASPTELGSEIPFMVKRDSAWNPFNFSNTITDDLIRRVDAARRNLADPPSGGAGRL
jgi:hypothetical protein